MAFRLVPVVGSLILSLLVCVPLPRAGAQDPARRGARTRTNRLAAADGGGWHRGESLVCSDCHTIHNSEGGSPMRYDGSPLPARSLLRMDSEVFLCLHCHDGANPLAPDVLEPVSYVADPAGGWMQFPGSVNPHGHDLLSATALRAPGSDEDFVLVCSSCHDPHGSSNYRNLLLDPPGSADDGSVEVVVDQQVLPDGGNPAQVYTPSNLVDRSGMGEFCNSCHDNFHGKSLGEEGGTERPWLRHPMEVTLFGSDHADYDHWSSALPNRVRVESPGDSVIPSSDDRVSCLSCHKGHGSGNQDSLIFANGQTRRSTCQQCHNK